MLQAGASLQAKTDGKTCLHLAVEKNNIELVKKLIDYEKQTRRKVKPALPYEDILFAAIVNKCPPKIIEALLGPAKKDARGGKFLGSYLHAAVRANRDDLITLLILNGVPLDQTEGNLLRSFQGGLETALDLARRKRDVYPDPYRILLFLHYSSSLSEEENTVISSQISNPIDCLSSLILFKSTLDEIKQFIDKDNQGRLPQDKIGMDSRWLHFTLKSEREDIPELLTFFIERGASCSAKDRQGLTAAEYAVQQGQFAAFKELVVATNGTQAQDNGFDKALLSFIEASEEKVPLELKKEITFAVLERTNHEKSRQLIDTRMLFPFIIACNNEGFIKDFMIRYPVNLEMIVDEASDLNIIEKACEDRHWEAVKTLAQLTKIMNPSALQTHSFHKGVKQLVAPEIAIRLTKCLWRAITKNAPKDVIDALIATGVNNHLPHLKGLYGVSKGDTISHYIIRYNRQDLLAILADFYTSDLEFHNREHKTPIDIAIELAIKKSDWSLIEQLIPMINQHFRHKFYDSAVKLGVEKEMREIIVSTINQKLVEEFNEKKEQLNCEHGIFAL